MTLFLSLSLCCLIKPKVDLLPWFTWNLLILRFFIKALGNCRCSEALSVPDYTHTRLIQCYSLLWFLIIISWCSGDMGSMGVGESGGKRGGSKVLAVTGVMSSSWTPACHIEINSACQANALQNIRCFKCRVKKLSWRCCIETILFHVSGLRISCCLSPCVSFCHWCCSWKCRR